MTQKTILTLADFNLTTGHFQVIGGKITVNASSVIQSTANGYLPLSAIDTVTSSNGQVLVSSGNGLTPSWQSSPTSPHTHLAADITDFNSAADGRIANAFGMSPSIYDTVKKLTDEMVADDSDFLALAGVVGDKLDKAGGTMTGKITLDGNPINDNHAANKKYVDDLFSIELVSVGGVSLGFIGA
jgi:hypothetical protein